MSYYNVDVRHGARLHRSGSKFIERRDFLRRLAVGSAHWR